MIGKYSARLDEKNRLIVPAKLRDELGERFFITIGINTDHTCLTIYTDADWQQLTLNYGNLRMSQRSNPTRLIFSNAAECVPDKQYRITIPGYLLDFAKIDREVTFVGNARQAEIWDADAFARYEAENLTPEKLMAALEDIGL